MAKQQKKTAPQSIPQSPAPEPEPQPQQTPPAAPAVTDPPAAPVPAEATASVPPEPAADTTSPPASADAPPHLADALASDGSFAAEKTASTGTSEAQAIAGVENAVSSGQLDETIVIPSDSETVASAGLPAEVLDAPAPTPASIVPGTVMTLPADFETSAPPRPTITSVLSRLHRRPAVSGTYLRKDLECRLTGDQAELLKRLFAEINHQGGDLRRPGYVLGWLLDTIAESLEPYEAEPAAAHDGVD
jgi:hypothetical protein